MHGEPPSEVKFDDRLKLSKVGVSSVVVTENISYLLDLEGRVYCGLDKEQNDSFEFGKLVSYELLNKQLIK